MPPATGLPLREAVSVDVACPGARTNIADFVFAVLQCGTTTWYSLAEPGICTAIDSGTLTIDFALPAVICGGGLQEGTTTVVPCSLGGTTTDRDPASVIFGGGGFSIAMAIPPMI